MPRKKRAPAQLSPLAAYLKKELDDRDLTLVEIETATGIPDATLSRIFNGTVTDPKGSQLAKIANAMGIPFWKVWVRVNPNYKEGVDDPPADAIEEMQRIAAIIVDEPDLSGIMAKLTTMGPRDLRAVRKYIELLKSGD